MPMQVGALSGNLLSEFTRSQTKEQTKAIDRTKVEQRNSALTSNARKTQTKGPDDRESTETDAKKNIGT